MSARGSEIEAADRHCRSLASRHYENFSVASWFLARDVRMDLMRVYAYCRTTDDFGDESARAAPLRLAHWRRDVTEYFGGAPPIHPVLIALRETVARRGLTAEPFLDLIAANEQDQRVHSYPTWAALHDYCMHSAAPVGRIVLRVFGLTDPALVPLSDDVCIGLQLANFAQDVSRDAAIGRTYLIGDEIAALGTVGATEALCRRARELLSSGERLEAKAPGTLRLQLILYRLGGLAICDAIERQGYRTADRRPRVSKKTKAVLVARASLRALERTERKQRAQPA